MTVIVNYTQSQVNEIKYQLNTKYSILATKSAREVLYRIKCCNLELLEELFLYKWVLDDYVMSSNGYADSILTPEQFSCIAQRIKQISC